MKALLVTFALIFSSSLLAQPVITTQGIQGQMDREDRSPVLSTRILTEGGVPKIFADAYVQHKDYVDYPMQFEFYVNRRLFSTQIRSLEQPGPVGVAVGADVAAVPFTYAVAVKVMTPNRDFTTLMSGTFFEASLAGTLTCNLVLTNVETQISVAYLAENVPISQTSNTTIALSFEGETGDGEEHAEASGSLTVSGTAVSGELIVAENDDPISIPVTGAIVTVDGTVQSLSVNNAESGVALTCN